MRFPWQRRADEEQRRRLAAERRLKAVEADWPDVIHHAAAMQYQKQLNGWTGGVQAIFGNRKREQGR